MPQTEMYWRPIETYDKENCPQAILAFPGGATEYGRWWKGYPDYHPEGGWRCGDEEVLVKKTWVQPWMWMPWPDPPTED